MRHVEGSGYNRLSPLWTFDVLTEKSLDCCNDSLHRKRALSNCVIFQLLGCADGNTQERCQGCQCFVAIRQPDLRHSGHKSIMFGLVAYPIDLTHMVVTEKWLIVERLTASISNGKSELAGRRDENLMA